MQTSKRDALYRPGYSLQQVQSERGITLLECLVAISVIAILGAMIGPPIVFTAATRLQNQRAEQAFQIAQGEVDRIRVLVARGDHIPASLPPVVAALDEAPAPTGVSTIIKSIRQNCPGTAYAGQQIPFTQMLQVDTTGDCEADFLMQVYRTNNDPAIADQQNRPIDFSVGVRVYSARAEEYLGDLTTRPASLRITSGEGDYALAEDGVGRSQKGPLAVFNSNLIWTDRSEALCDYQGNTNC
ncbi:MAG: type II secretion system protein [Leptolyngbyaceae cyanobacterium RM1_405_57]|nr:type II secretion system protein [Leptolyngbyaceae cyanobacterium RM1_405_57]